MNVIEVAIEARTQSGRAALDVALEQLRQNRPWMGLRCNSTSGQAVLSGRSEDELEQALRTLSDDKRVDFRAGDFQVVYREALSKRTVITHTHAKVTGSRGEFAEVEIEFEPLPPGSGFVFENGIVGESVPSRFIPAIETGVRSEAERGLLVGFPVVDFRARLVDGKYHEMDSTPRTFEIAARAAFRKLAAKGVVQLWEPIMKVEAVTPEDCFGKVLGDLNARGQIHNLEARADRQVLVAMVPMSHLFGYSAALNTATDGRGQLSMVFDHYEIVPNSGDDPRFPGAAAARIA
jgi:elongation factor G